MARQPRPTYGGWSAWRNVQTLGLRAQVVLAAADHQSLTAIARTYGVSRPYVYRWLERWRTEGLAGLADQRSLWSRKHAQASCLEFVTLKNF